MRKLMYSALTVLLLTGCKKDDDEVPADTAAVITVNSPVANGLFNNGSPISIQGTIDDVDGLKSAKVEVKHRTAGTVYYTTTAPLANIPRYIFNWNWTVTGMTATVPAVIKITSTDQYDYTTTNEVNITLEN